MEIYKLKVTSAEGTESVVEGPEGYRVMEVIRDNGIPIKAECNGCLACATCHVYVDEKWIDKLIPPTDEEKRMLDDAFFVQPNSRLSCQILMSKEIDGLEVTVAPSDTD